MIAFATFLVAVIGLVSFLLSEGSRYFTMIGDIIGNGITFLSVFKQMAPPFLGTFIAVIVFICIVAVVIKLIPFIGG